MKESRIYEKQFEGVITSDVFKAFLVDLYKTGKCSYMHVDLVEDNWSSKKDYSKCKTIFDNSKLNGVKITVSFWMKERDNEDRPRLSDNPIVKGFVEKYNLYMK